MKFTPTFIDNPAYIPLKIVRDSINNSWETSLSYYILIKKLHQKPVIYNYSLRKLSAILKCSPSTLSKHLNILSNKDLITIKERTLMLKGTTALNEQVKSILIPIKVAKTKKEQITYIRYANIKRNLDNQHSEVTKKKNVLSLKAPTKKFKKGEAKKLIKLRSSRYNNLEFSVCDSLVLSNKKFGQLCNRSQSTGVRIQKELNKVRLIRSDANIQLISDVYMPKQGFYALCLPSSYFLSGKGQIYRRLANRIGVVGALRKNVIKN